MILQCLNILFFKSKKIFSLLKNKQHAKIFDDFLFFENMDKVALIKDLIAQLFKKMGFSFSKISLDEDGNILRINIETEEASLLIGSQGKNLEALQQVVKSMLYKHLPDENVFLILDIEGFKKRRQDQVLDLAREKAQVVKSTRITQILPSMNSYMRRMVHMEFTKPEYDELTTDSIGEEGERRVRILWKGNAKVLFDE